jgi:SET domain-containing protein
MRELLSFRESSIHGLGGFALVDIRAGARIIEYVGEKISKRESLVRCEANNEFIFCLDELFDLDGNVGWNPAKYLNHSCAPNAAAECDQGAIWIVAQRDIRAGEEVTFNYGYALEDWREHPCQCGSSACVGYMVDVGYFPLIRRLTAEAAPVSDA